MKKIILLISIIFYACGDGESSNIVVKIPEAISDQYFSEINKELSIDDFLDNDQNILSLTTIELLNETTAKGGKVVLNDKIITYNPLANFEGVDTFQYKICNDSECATATISITLVEPLNLSIPDNLKNYYNNLTLSIDKDFNFNSVSKLTTENHTNILSYGQRHNYLYDADEDAANTANVILMYTGESRDEREYTSGNNSHSLQTFNTEHVYPQSKLNADDAVTDLHHLRATDAQVNSNRSNFPFTDGSGSNTLVDGNKWYPGDEWKGDVARMIFYLNVRYGETFEKVGTLELFLKWNREDPVSDFEIQRNNIIQDAQGNRNPFIDNPYIATLIWGGEAAENKWE